VTVVWALLHDLGESGVPIALERMLAWHALYPRAEVHVVAERDGPRRARIEASATSVTALEPEAGRTPAATAAVAIRQAGATGLGGSVRARAWRHRVRALPDPDVVLLQGAGAWETWAALEPRLLAGGRLVVHLHELETGLDRSVPPDQVAALLGRADAVLAVSAPVVRLAEQRGARRGSVVEVPGVVDPLAPRVDPAHRELLVAGIGEPGWRKGTDLFLAVAHEVGRLVPGATARWVGGRPDADAPFPLDAEPAAEWCPPTTDPWAEVAEAGVLLVPSREDPLPLVALEAGWRGVPVVAAATGGLPSLLADGRGTVVPGHHLQDMARAVADLLGDRDAAQSAADALAAHVDAHHLPQVVGPPWLRALLG
jgi:glycosyltransferase involved in cell wall biosynthesis